MELAEAKARLRHLDLADLRVRYWDEGSGRPVLLLHGWPESCLTFRKNVPELARHVRVIAPDIRGFGRSRRHDGKADERIDAETAAADMIALLDALGVREPVGIVSHDVGSNVAQHLARTRPDRVADLFFFNCSYVGIGKRWSEPEQLLIMWYQFFHQMPWVEKLVGHSPETARIYLTEMIGGWTATPGDFDQADIDDFAADMIYAEGLKGGLAWYRGLLPLRLRMMKEGAIALPAIPHRTRFLWGARDPILRAAWTDALGAYFTDHTLAFAEGAAHFVHYEAPERANAEMIAFFANSPGGGRASAVFAPAR
ncbi:MAG: alpha/beta hydrolase [Tagaea sp.]|nr:alpha/beta hydrolase [Tagaea sp.]